MGVAQLNPNQNKFGAGEILMAPAGTTMPMLTVAGGVFTNDWPGFLSVGGTTGGMVLTRTPAISDFVVAESYWPQHILVTGDDIQAAFTLAQVNKANLAFAFNASDAATLAGTGGNFSVSGSGSTKLAGFSSPLIGKETRGMVIWVSQDNDEMIVIYEGLNVVAVAPNMNKGPAAQELALNIRGELPATNPDSNLSYLSTDVIPWRWYVAGTWAD